MRRRLIGLAVLATVLGLLHHADHIVRANHVGWPVIAELNPFSFSLLAYVLLIPGVWLTATRRVGARYWIAAATPLLLLVAFVHFNPDPRSEYLDDIYLPYANPAAYCGANPPVHPPKAMTPLCIPEPATPRPWLGVLAVANMLALITTLATLLVVVVRARGADQ